MTTVLIRRFLSAIHSIYLQILMIPSPVVYQVLFQFFKFIGFFTGSLGFPRSLFFLFPGGRQIDDVGFVLKAHYACFTSTFTFTYLFTPLTPSGT